MPVLKNQKHEHYAQFIAQGMSGRKAYLSAGYDAGNADSCASRLSKHVQVAARIEELRTALAQGILKVSIRETDQRLSRQQDRWDRMHRVIEERANSPEMEAVAGGKTGLLVRKLKQIGAGDNAQVVEEYEVDTGLLSEIRKHEEHAARELGQWIDPGAKGDTNLVLSLPRVTVVLQQGAIQAQQPSTRVIDVTSDE